MLSHTSEPRNCELFDGVGGDRALQGIVGKEKITKGVYGFF